jgi:hypothetical protein
LVAQSSNTKLEQKMMNLRLIAIVAAFVIGVASVVDASISDFRRVMLDDDTVHQNCIDKDWEMIDEILLASTTLVYNGESNQRRLERSRTLCKALCIFYVTGQCRVPGCEWINPNRRLGSIDAQQGEDVPSEPEFECSAQHFDFIRSEFTYLVHTESITSMCYDTLSEVLSIMCEDRN